MEKQEMLVMPLPLPVFYRAKILIKMALCSLNKTQDCLVLLVCVCIKRVCYIFYTASPYLTCPSQNNTLVVLARKKQIVGLWEGSFVCQGMFIDCMKRYSAMTS